MIKQRRRAGLVRALGMWLVAALLGLVVPLIAPATASASGPPTGTAKTVLLLHDPVLEFYTYGAHNLSHVYGYHTLVNNQCGTATFDVCDGWNGTQCEGLTGLGTLGMDVTPINSVVLIP